MNLWNSSMPRITDYLVQDYEDTEFDKSTLHKPSFNVNMRIFRTSPFYRQIIADVINYMDSHLSMIYEDNSTPLGISGAKLSIPWNIIGFKCKGKNKFCINPKILKVSKDTTETTTNCGALRLKKDIKVLRYNLIELEYYDLKGQRIVEANIGRYEGAFIIQHEVDHNLGICITDKEIKETK